MGMVVSTYGCTHEVDGSTLRGGIGLQLSSTRVLTGAHVCSSQPKCDGLHGCCVESVLRCDP
jgi:hypothetical protein